MERTRGLRTLASLSLLITTLSACGGRGAEPPRPSLVRTPDVVGVIVTWDFGDCGEERYTLDTGEVITLTAGEGRTICDGEERTPTPRLSATDILVGEAGPGENIETGALLLYGEDEGGPWYAGAQPERGQRGEVCPYRIAGGAFDDGKFLHFSSGLRLPKAQGFAVTPDYIDDPFPLRARDTICLDENGTVLSAEVFQDM